MAEKVKIVPERKRLYKLKLEQLLRNNKSAIMVNANNIGSKQLQDVRIELRGRATVLMGKNTMIRRILRDFSEEDEKVENLIPCVRGNTGFVFTSCDLKEIIAVIKSNTVPAMARPGVVAPQDVVIEAGATGLDPGQTAFFQSLNIATKIQRGQIEMVNKTYLIKKGNRVGSSECALLNKLEIKPFKWALQIESIYTDGNVLDEDFINMSEADLMSKFFSGVRVIAALGLQLGIPNLASVPHSFANAFKKLLCISVGTDYTFEAAQKYKDFLADPDAYAAAHGLNASGGGGGGGGDGGGGGADEEKDDEPAVVEESEEEVSSAGGAVQGLFGADSDDDESSSEEESD